MNIKEQVRKSIKKEAALDLGIFERKIKELLDHQADFE